MNKQITLFREVKTNGGSGWICLPKKLAGKKVKITFLEELTDKEKQELQLQKLRNKIRKIKRGELNE